MDYDADYDTDVEIDGVDVESPSDDADYTRSEDGASASNNVGSNESDDNQEYSSVGDSTHPESERGRFLGDSRHGDDEDDEDEDKKKRKKSEDQDEEERKPTNPIWFDLIEGAIKLCCLKP